MASAARSATMPREPHVDQLLDDLGIDDRPAGGDRAHGVDQVVGVADAILEEVARRSEPASNRPSAYNGDTYWLSTTTPTSGWLWRRSMASRTPSSVPVGGMRMSVMTTSGARAPRPRAAHRVSPPHRRPRVRARRRRASPRPLGAGSCRPPRPPARSPAQATAALLSGRADDGVSRSGRRRPGSRRWLPFPAARGGMWPSSTPGCAWPSLSDTTWMRDEEGAPGRRIMVWGVTKARRANSTLVGSGSWARW